MKCPKCNSEKGFRSKQAVNPANVFEAAGPELVQCQSCGHGWNRETGEEMAMSTLGIPKPEANIEFGKFGDTTWQKLQLEVSDWALNNFGLQGAHQPMLGLIEEVGEFCSETEMVGKPDLDAMEDAIADQVIYVLNLCEICGLDFHKDIVAMNGPESLTDRELLGSLALGCQAVLKFDQRIRNMTFENRKAKLSVALGMWFRWASYQSGYHGFAPILPATIRVWEKVKKRDWRKNPGDADKVAAFEEQVQCKEFRSFADNQGQGIEFCLNNQGHNGPHRFQSDASTSFSRAPRSDNG